MEDTEHPLFRDIYILNNEKEVVPCKDYEEWANFFFNIENGHNTICKAIKEYGDDFRLIIGAL